MKCVYVKSSISVALALSGFMFAGSAQATYTASFAKFFLVQNFCSDSSTHCREITQNASGYTVTYESAQGTTSGPKRGDGDGEPDG